MNKTTHQNTVYPQTVEIPEPLEVHPSVSPLAAELLMKTAEILARTPKLYSQSVGGAGECDTPCCILGHMRRLVGVQNIYWKDCASDLGLTLSQASKIFITTEWPKQFRSDFITASIGIARINRFLSTGQ